MKSDLATFHKRKTGGHYARVMGTLHRHLKTEQAGDAALGMLARIWSYCADVGRHVLTERDLAVIMVRDKNGPRKLRALLDARLLDEVEGGFSPHDWFDHNPGIAPRVDTDVSGTRVDGESNVTGNVTQIVTRNASEPPERKRVLTPPLLDSGLRTQENLRDSEENLRPAAAEPPLGVRISELESRYREGLCADVRRACALSRRNGKMADSVWFQTLEALAAHETAHAEGAMVTFSERYADGEKDERYLLGICRGNAKGERQSGSVGRPGKVRPTAGTTHLDFESYPSIEEQFAKAGV